MVEAKNIIDYMEKKKCKVCGSTNTYFTKKTKFCRACGHEERRFSNVK